MQPAFHPQRLLTYADIILKHTNLLISECVHREVNIARHLNRLTLLFAAETLFGARVTDVADQASFQNLHDEVYGDAEFGECAFLFLNVSSPPAARSVCVPRMR